MGVKGDSRQFGQWAAEVANGLIRKYPPGVLLTSEQKLEGLSKENADELRYQEIAEKIAQQKFAILLAGDYKIATLQPTLKNYLEAPTSTVDVRTSALRSLLKIDAVKNMELAGNILQSDSATLDLKKRVVLVAGEFQGSAMDKKGSALNKMLARVKNAPSDLQLSVVTVLSNSSEGRDIVFQQVRNGELASRMLLDPKVEERILLNISPRQQKEYESLTANLDPIDGERQALVEARLKAFKATNVAAHPYRFRTKCIRKKLCDMPPACKFIRHRYRTAAAWNRKPRCRNHWRRRSSIRTVIFPKLSGVIPSNSKTVKC
ncbi:MAG: hypothetical protein WDN75_00950 [Bacteroidota bacterium]